ncbi:EIN3-binding F-box protein 1 [Auxenochlorella protothecoides]|uniref:EIN3-binding F-box protein 1 n=1 Tax=Auxenochlorella protothecoides TaxID=3075 RepID=A0A087SIQ9_AUXPR|nr:EIN3-binding F-box protein 1 [Auxenochlorella protothecoides]KFM25613.1 EIN3-binding F-box protein 1 [Auxenochlorella protothecoides]
MASGLPYCSPDAGLAPECCLDACEPGLAWPTPCPPPASKGPHPPWSSLPTDVMGAVCAGLAPRDLCCARLACRAWSASLSRTVASLAPRTPRLQALAARFPALQELDLLDLTGCAGVSCRGLAALGPALGRLRHLRLGSCGAGAAGEADAVLRLLGSACARLTDLDLAGFALTGAGLLALAPLGASLETLGLWNCATVPDAELGALAALPRLADLSLRGWHQLTDAGAEALGALPRLVRLDLRACEQLRGEGLAALAAAGGLHTLDLRRCHALTDAGVAAVGRLASLRSLLLDGCWQVTGPGLAGLAGLRNLERLSLQGCRGVYMPDGGALPGLGACAALQSLSLRLCDRLAGGALGFLASLPDLRSLDLSSCRLLTGEDLGPLAGAAKLTTLRAEHCLGLEGRNALAALGACPALQSLFLCGCRKLDGAALGALRPLRDLRLLSLHGCHGVPGLDAGLDAMLAAGPPSHPCLATLSLQGCDSVSDKGVAALGRLPALRTLHLSDCAGVEGRGFGAWGAAGDDGTAPPLAELHLQNCGAVSDAGAAAVARLASLRELRLKACRALTEQGLASLAAGLSNLTTLSLQNMTLTDGGVRPLARLAKLESLELQFWVTALTVLQELTRLDLLYSWQVTDSVLADLAAMPNLRRLNLTGCHRISRAGRESIAHLLPTDRQELS